MNILLLIILRCPTGPGFYFFMEVVMDKVFLTTELQLQKLREKGMLITDEEKTKEIIEKENYYKLINGYKTLFINTKNGDVGEAYRDGTRFEEIYALYLFDRELRSIFMRYILEVENNVKSILAHDFSEKYGHENYLKIVNFDVSVKKWEKKTSAQKMGEITDLIADLQHEISRQLSKNNPMISHYMLDVGYVPLWVLVNVLTLGTISIFYSYLSQRDQNDIGRKLGLKPDEMNSILKVLTIYRNACAHDERLFSLKSVKRNLHVNSICTMDIHKRLNIPVDAGNNPIFGKNDLFAVVIIFKLVLSESAFAKFFVALEKEVDDLSSELNSITIDEVQRKMGFPSTWRNIKNL